jgi:ParB family chromosome partitioning protein
MGKTAIDAPRSNLFLVEPEKLTLITDKTHKLYDPRVERPLNEGLVLSMLAGGAFDPVLVFKDGEKLVVIDGRQRVKAAMEANKRIESKKSGPSIRLEVIVKKADEGIIFALQSAANENRQETTDLERAKILQRMMGFGFNEAEAGQWLGFDKARVKRILSLLDCDKKVQDAVQAGVISSTAAAQLSTLERVKQVVELDKLIAESGGKRVRVRAATKATAKAKGKKTASDAPNRKEITKLWEFVQAKPEGNEPMEHLRARLAIADVLSWVLTGAEGSGFVSEFCNAPKAEKATKGDKANG